MSGHDIRTRLALYKYDKDVCEAAIHGEDIPYALGLPLTRHRIVRRIHHHHGFGEELRGVLPEFTQALNGRSIMSDHITLMSGESEFPDRTWHPQVAAEATYREVIRRYPDMAYQVGRACAVAGYVDLYEKLDILPEVHIAEEAREAGNLAIYEDIMSKSVRYAVMNDYTRTISTNSRPGACLNGDTAVYSSLEKKQAFFDVDDFEFSDEDE
jgi:hypothetical protein